MRFRNLHGFTVAEFLISLAIIVILATMTVFELGNARYGDELRTAAQQLSGDIRAMQSEAIAGKDVKACDIGAEYSICENTAAQCGVNPCEPVIPQAYGIHAVNGSSTYILFADINPLAGTDRKYTDSDEQIAERSLVALDSTGVYIDDISSSNASGLSFADIAFTRQHGDTAFTDATTPPEPVLMTIRLRHVKTNKTISVEVNGVTGRVSIL